MYPGADWETVEKQIKLQSDITQYVDGLDFKPDYIHPEYKTLLAQPEVIEEMHSKGTGVNAWIPNDEAALEKLLAVGVDGVITDTPDIAHDVGVCYWPKRTSK